MNLYVWPGYQNLESFDPESLAVITYIRIAKARMNIFKGLRPWYKPQFSLPLLKHSLNESKSIKEIIPYFRKENYGVEYELSDTDLAQLNILAMNIHQDLIPAVQYLMWFDEHNYNRVTRPIVGSLMGLPMCLIWPNILRKRMMATVSNSRLCFLTLDKFNLNPDSMKSVLYDAGKRCLTSLEYILNESGFFVGKRPTYVEAVLYGYLWPLLNLGYESDGLVSHLKLCPKLVELLSGLHRRYYPHLNVPAPLPGSNATIDGGNTGLVASTRHYLAQNWIQIRNSCAFVVIVTTLMVSYTRFTRRPLQ